VLRITGDYPRMYVYQPARKRQWGDVEITAYFKRVRDRGVPYAGMVAVARSHHLQTRNACDTRGYGARMRYDGTTDFEKETSHPANEATSSKRLWKRGMPYRKWIGYKFVVFDKKAGVKLELWADQRAVEEGEPVPRHRSVVRRRAVQAGDRPHRSSAQQPRSAGLGVGQAQPDGVLPQRWRQAGWPALQTGQHPRDQPQIVRDTL
jgi:hypothetical protein